VQADMLGVEFGAGIRHSDNSEMLRVRYQTDWEPVDRLMSFIDLSATTWNGDDSNDAVSAGLGLRYDLPQDNYLSAAMGLAYVTNETDNLGTHGQLQFRFALGHRVDRWDFSVAYSHYSNAKGIFGWNGPNLGEDFITLQFGYHFGAEASEVTPLPTGRR